MGNGERGTCRRGESLVPRSFLRLFSEAAGCATAVALPHSPFPVPRSPRAKRANGFSLLEVIAAILLLAITFAALMQVAGSSIGLTNNAADHAQAALWARSLLDTVDLDAPLQPGGREGRFNAQYRWRLKVAPWSPGNANPDAPLRVYKVDLDVLWGSQAHERAAHFSTLRLASAHGGGQLPMLTR
ncbi:type IV pilus modification PilV family protein [Dyella tabacisoli]|uniref:Type II secretion system protein n=2 Tax=Dyella tabacisoli TaxID=2282381 RepID=A0A369UK61_9GAMM|nr:type II secretion system protein [Dyella tabacisoli]RDD80713.1 type II secretion system protein [Dyella tabacisoli]